MWEISGPGPALENCWSACGPPEPREHHAPDAAAPPEEVVCVSPYEDAGDVESPSTEEGGLSPPEIRHRSDLTQQSSSEELMRAISMRKSLQQAARLWRLRPPALSLKKRARLYDASSPTAAFDVFLSHTWLTDGRLKALSLLIRFGWPTLLLGWLIGAAMSFPLCLTGILPQFRGTRVVLDSEPEVPDGYWVLICSTAGAMLGLLAFPYLPSRSDRCFLDFVSISQTDERLMQEGIDNIGNFLAATGELRVLWSEPYLTRIWCIFELAAFRKMNPTGKIRVVPLLVDAACSQVFLFALLVAIVYPSIRGSFRSRNAGFLAIISFVCLAFGAALVRVIVQCQRCVHKMVLQLSTFDVTTLQCSKQRDLESIHAAIVHWYGSLEAFTAHVRGPFRVEVLTLMRSEGIIPFGYILVGLASAAALPLGNLVSLLLVGASWESWLTYALAYLVALDMMWFPSTVYLTITACEYVLWSEKKYKVCRYSAIGVMFAFLMFAGIVAASLALSSWVRVLSWLCVATVYVGFSWRISKACAMAYRELEK
ncbi:unnamed protein product [Symbiodinium natans]|uniref:Transmembrane protein n=1 Tax=Symbiodinium natans TaxID=878477 RepID=A0A812NU07_9DINO|nr:unnamed protein product [Symbiodinium natans]